MRSDLPPEGGGHEREHCRNGAPHDVAPRQGRALPLELGSVIGSQQSSIGYRFISGYPFKGHAPHVMVAFERQSLASLRGNPDQPIVDVSAFAFSDRVRLIAPVLMGQACVSCHDTHPDSPKRDRKVGGVRGTQEVIVTQPIA